MTNGVWDSSSVSTASSSFSKVSSSALTFFTVPPKFPGGPRSSAPSYSVFSSRSGESCWRRLCWQSSSPSANRPHPTAPSVLSEFVSRLRKPVKRTPHQTIDRHHHRPHHNRRHHQN